MFLTDETKRYIYSDRSCFGLDTAPMLLKTTRIRNKQGRRFSWQNICRTINVGIRCLSRIPVKNAGWLCFEKKYKAPSTQGEVCSYSNYPVSSTMWSSDSGQEVVCIWAFHIKGNELLSRRWRTSPWNATVHEQSGTISLHSTSKLFSSWLNLQDAVEA